jgi:hypothetical protein
MHSRSSLLALALVLASACGTDSHTTTCQASYLTYDNFGEPYLASWCRGCHSSDLPANMRQLALADINFNTLADVRAQLGPMQSVIATGAMPPEGGPSADEQQLMMQWLSCGAP